MKYYASRHKQLDLGLFRSSLDGLDKSNRWVMLADRLPWTELEEVYNSRLANQKKGAGNKPARMIIGAMIIKHKLSLSDEETIDIIRENPYMQYLCGLPEFTDNPIFDSSLFVTIRRRISEVEINQMTVCLLKQAESMTECDSKSSKEDGTENTGDSQETTSAQLDQDAAPFTDSKGRKHKGVLKIDATCADAEIRYPVDVDLIHDGCRKVNDYIIKVCKVLGLRKPNTNYKDARRAYLLLIKLSKKKGKMVRHTIAVMLSYLRRDMRTLLDLLGKNMVVYNGCFSKYEKRILTAIFKMFRQQEWMYSHKENTCTDRILSIFQPHVRAILRGKAKAKAEFGAKIGASIVNGYTFIDHHSWHAYNESQDLQRQIELYKERFGYLPSTILADKIYMNKANRAIIGEFEIQNYCKPLGRPPKVPPSEEVKSKMRKAVGDRNEIEGTFGTGKRIYRANNIRAKLPDTSKCWTGMCYFVKNVMKFLRGLYLVSVRIQLIWINCAKEGRYSYYSQYAA